MHVKFQYIFEITDVSNAHHPNSLTFSGFPDLKLIPVSGRGFQEVSTAPEGFFPKIIRKSLLGQIILPYLEWFFKSHFLLRDWLNMKKSLRMQIDILFREKSWKWRKCSQVEPPHLNLPLYQHLQLPVITYHTDWSETNCKPIVSSQCLKNSDKLCKNHFCQKNSISLYKPIKPLKHQ